MSVVKEEFFVALRVRVGRVQYMLIEWKSKADQLNKKDAGLMIQIGS